MSKKNIISGWALFYGNPAQGNVVRIYKTYKSIKRAYLRVLHMFGSGKFYIQCVKWGTDE